MSARLSLYLVEHYPRIDNSTEPSALHIALVVAESVDQAQTIVAYEGTERYLAQTETVGRLGYYEPGLEGHNMVIRRPQVILRSRA